MVLAVLLAWYSKEKLDWGWQQTIVMFIIGGIILLVYLTTSENIRIKLWQRRYFPLLTSFQFSNLLYENSDSNKVRYYENIPYNRALYFSSGTEINIELESVSTIFYDARPADNEMTFQEYGFLVASLGVIIKKQVVADLEDIDNKYDVQTTCLPFANAYRYKVDENSLQVYYADRTNIHIELEKEKLEFIEGVFKQAIESGWTYHVEDVIAEENVLEDEYDVKMSELDDAVEKVMQKVNLKAANQQVVDASVAGSLNVLQGELNQNQINDRFGAGQGHGHVGEHFGDLLDKLKFKRTEKMGSSHEKHGADRIINGTNIQTKFSATAGKSIGQAFEASQGGGGAKYKNADGTMMKIEVPKDQYADALKVMANKIKQGKVPNESNPDNAGKYVVKGAVTYEQAQIATKSIFDRKSTIVVRDDKGNAIRDKNNEVIKREVTLSEKLIYSAGGDFLTGARAALPFAVTTGVWVYCNSIWQGADQKDALKNSMVASVKPCLTGGMIYMVSSQFAGSQIGKNVGNLYASHIVKTEMTNKLKTQAVTKSAMGVVVVVITVGPDLADCLRGRISVNQLVKNTLSTGTGMVSGALLGNAAGSFIPGVGNAIGTLVGGTVGAITARKILDKFVEDDVISMIRKAKEEFIEAVMMNSLSEEEFQRVLDKTFLHKKFNKLLKTMYSAEDSREYIHNHFLRIVEDIYLERELPDEYLLLEAGRMHFDNWLMTT